MKTHRVRVGPFPSWLDRNRLLGPGTWSSSDQWVEAELPTEDAAYLQERLRKVILDGTRLSVHVRPSLKRPQIRKARSRIARDLRETTPGFSRSDARLDATSRAFLTPEKLALDIARDHAGATVLDAGCGAGGNAIAFARQGCRVIAVDHSEERLAQARHNARVYGVADSIRFLRGDAAAVLLETPADVLFVDPPWGHLPTDAPVRAADLPLLQSALDHWRGRFRSLVIKAPAALDTRDLGPSARPRAVFGLRPGDRRRIKFLLIRDGDAAR